MTYIEKIQSIAKIYSIIATECDKLESDDMIDKSTIKCLAVYLLKQNTALSNIAMLHIFSFKSVQTVTDRYDRARVLLNGPRFAAEYRRIQDLINPLK